MLSCQKHQFSLPDDLHYLNCAYMSPLSQRVEAAGLAGLQQKRNPSLIGPDDFFEDSDTARRLFAGLINADPSRIALIPSASYGTATVARNLEVRRGQNLVVMHEQFPSNIYSWHRLAAETGAEVRVVKPPDGAPRGARWNERILDTIDADTAVVAMAPVHWADGTRFDLERIGERAREVNAAFVVDGTQAVGALPFDVQTIQPDALICAGYKWLLGPYSIGVAYFGPRFDGGLPLEENWITRRGSENFSGLVLYEPAYQPGATRYDVGERSNFILVPMLIAGLEHLHEWEVEAIQRYCADLARDLLREAQELGFSVEEEDHRSAHLFGLRLPSHVTIDQLRALLDERNISVSLRGDAIRIAPHVYNDAEDVDALREALHACVHASPATSP
ncbi:MAG TPA: aminotransferase class V-fold PLP-dependent enzyme [Rhodothermales bacterium]|nr:aminotransferase class V-fold PLP-dependent enzyme [Rhodothermales bacterium]